jgi:hypothetical protein
MRARMPGAKHPTVNELKEKTQREYDSLHFTQNGQVKPRFAPEIMDQKLKDLESRYDAELVAIMEKAERDLGAAREILERVESPYTWLKPEEEERAARLAGFYKEDFSRLDKDGLIPAVESAAKLGRVEQWLALRYAEERYRELDQSLETTLGMGAKARYSETVGALRDSLIPPDRIRERESARETLQESQNLRDAAEWQRPQVRQDFATMAKVDVKYLD